MTSRLFAIISLLSLVAMADDFSNDHAASPSAPPADPNLIPIDAPFDEFLNPQPDQNGNVNLDITILSSPEDPCDILCAGESIDEPGCYTDGIVYRNQCVARCNSEKNVHDFKCSDVQDGTCQSTCSAVVEKRKCRRQCSIIGNKFSVFCFNNGSLQVDSCRAQCENPNAIPQFNCLTLKGKISECWSVCQSFNNAFTNEQCHNESQDWVCASNGLIYAGACRAALMEQTVLGSAQGNSMADQEACAKLANPDPPRLNSITN
jgi:hypothetical protein